VGDSFNDIDIEKKGYITQVLLDHFLGNLKMDPPMNYLEKDALFSAIDVNKTGQISRLEYLQVVLKDEYKALKEGNLKKYHSEFSLMNKALADRGTKSLKEFFRVTEGHVSAKEFQEQVPILGLNQRDPKFNEIMIMFEDPEKRGIINISEMQQSLDSVREMKIKVEVEQSAQAAKKNRFEVKNEVKAVESLIQVEGQAAQKSEMIRKSNIEQMPRYNEEQKLAIKKVLANIVNYMEEDKTSARELLSKYDIKRVGHISVYDFEAALYEDLNMDRVYNVELLVSYYTDERDRVNLHYFCSDAEKLKKAKVHSRRFDYNLVPDQASVNNLSAFKTEKVLGTNSALGIRANASKIEDPERAKEIVEKIRFHFNKKYK
jgi:hypothetical protein